MIILPVLMISGSPLEFGKQMVTVSDLGVHAQVKVKFAIFPEFAKARKNLWSMKGQFTKKILNF